MKAPRAPSPRESAKAVVRHDPRAKAVIRHNLSQVQKAMEPLPVADVTRVPRLSEEEIYTKELLSAIDALAELRFGGNRVLALVHVLNTVEREIESSPLWKATGEKADRAARLLDRAARYPNAAAFAKVLGVESDAMKLRLRRARADLARLEKHSELPTRVLSELPKATPRGRPRRGKG